MITNKINTLFEFIEFLHSNINNFKQYNSLLNELEKLGKERSNIKPLNNYIDKLKYDEIQAEIERKFNVIKENIYTPIKNKAIELNVCNFKKEPLYSWYGIETEIHELKRNFSKDDLPEIFKHKRQYIEYRTNTHKTFLSLSFFFDELDEITKSIFDFFKETKYNEFEAFETKVTKVNSIDEVAKQILAGNNKIILESQPQNKITEQSNKELSLNDILNKQNNLIPDVPIQDVYDHFKQLTTITNKFNRHILTNAQLLIFIKSTFIDETPIKQKWNNKPRTKKSVRKIFYEFYQNSMNTEKNNKNLKQKYFDIMDKSFEGFNDNDYNDFNKT